MIGNGSFRRYYGFNSQALNLKFLNPSNDDDALWNLLKFGYDIQSMWLIGMVWLRGLLSVLGTNESSRCGSTKNFELMSSWRLWRRDIPNAFTTYPQFDYMFEQWFIGKLKLYSGETQSLRVHITISTIKSSATSNLFDLYIDLLYHDIERQRLR